MPLNQVPAKNAANPSPTLFLTIKVFAL